MSDGRGASRSARLWSMALVVAFAGIVGAALMAAPARADGFAWDGASALPNWSDPTNWDSASAPSDTVDTLSFPALTNNACTTSPPATTCYASNNDASGLSANAISIDDGAGYVIDGDLVALGGGGITAAPSQNDPALAEPASVLNLPLTISAPQAWTITGGADDAQLLVTATVSGATADPLAIDLNDQTGLTLADAEVGPVTVAGDGTLGDGVVKLGYFGTSGNLVAGSLNATDGAAVRVIDGATLQTDDGATGPVSTTSAAIALGEADQAGMLAVNGNVSLDASSGLAAYISQAGTVAGTDYSQLSSNRTVNLGSATLELIDGQLPDSTACELLQVGDVDTLVSATGGVDGPLVGVVDGTTEPLADGATVSLYCFGSGGTPPTATIHYTKNSVTAAIETAGIPGTKTTTALAASPSSIVTNQPVTLTATIESSSAAPIGTVEFDNSGTAIPGCVAQPVAGFGGSYTATCQTTFAASPTPDVTAALDPADGSTVGPSTSTPADLGVGSAPTTTTLTISPSTVGPNQVITATANVTSGQAGAVQPTGTIDFLANGAPGPVLPGGQACSASPVTDGLTSICQITFVGGAGDTAEAITASYSGDANFGASTSASDPATYVGPPVAGGSPTAPTITSVGATGQASFGRASVTATMADVIVVCKGTKGERCTVSLKLTTREKTKGTTILSAAAAAIKTKATAHTVVVGTRTTTLDAGLGETVHISLNAAGKRALSRLHELPVTLTETQTTSHGAALPTTRRVTFKAIGKTV